MNPSPPTPTKTRITGVSIRAMETEASRTILTPEVLQLLSNLHREFEPQRKALLAARRERQEQLNAGALPDFPVSTRSIREREWKVAPIPRDLEDRRVEITGPTDRKMVINALNSGARVFMADFEDANSPTWDNLVCGQQNLRDAVRRTISFRSPEGKEYRLVDHPATLLVRPRGWHLDEKHLMVNGEPVSASLFDFALYAQHNAHALLERGTGPYFYLPKLEGHLEARLWNNIFEKVQDELGIPRGTFKATVLIEHILAAFEVDEILYELRDHAAGLNCGRWDYMFSFIKKFHRHPDFVLPDRAQVTMTSPMMRAYCLNVIKSCHRRGTHAIGGMAAQIPIKNDPAANEEALSKVRADKEREVVDGHDGTWVAHPGLVPLALDVFNAKMPDPNQISRRRDDVKVTSRDLLEVPRGTITECGLHTNVRVGVQYLASWLGGNGCVPINNLMEDAATAEISRTQVWQWIHHDRGLLDDGRRVTTALFRSVLNDALHELTGTVPISAIEKKRFSDAAALFDRISTDDGLVEFLTIPAYEFLD